MLNRLFNILKRKREQKKLKYSLVIDQNDEYITFQGSFAEDSFFAKELWLVERKTKKHFKIAEIESSNIFLFKIPLLDIANVVAENCDLESVNYDWFMKVKKPYENGSKPKGNNIKLLETHKGVFLEYFIRLGRFQYTEVNNLNFYKRKNITFINYITNKGNLSLVSNSEVKTPTKILIDKVKRRGSKLSIEGMMFTKSSRIEQGVLILRAREAKKDLIINNVNFKPIEDVIKLKYGLNRYRYSAEVDFKKLNQDNLIEEDVYDLFFEIKTHDMMDVKFVRIGAPSFKVRFFLKEFFAVDRESAAIVNPYFTFKASNLSLEVYKYPLDTYRYLKRMLRWAWLIRLINRKKEVWLVGERIYKAQDTGYAFFKYMRKNFPEKNVYYVIDKKSPEYKNIKELGNVLDFKSKKHIYYTLISKKILSSHHPDYLYPIRTEKFKNKTKATKIFLQHGIMGTKNMVANYGKNALSFDTDLFLVSSDFEKNMIVNDFGYSPNDVFVTGLSRFDSLLTKDTVKKNQVLIIPTWRDWIITEENFLESEYFKRYTSLIHNKKLHELASQYSFEIIFCLHPNMQRFTSHFNHPKITIINQGEVDVQQLIKESALMITDYSSVGFDFSFLYKPVLYYQFDVNRFIGKKGSHLDLTNDLPGEITNDQEELLTLIRNYAKSDFKVKGIYKIRADKFLKYRDVNSCKRIYEVALNNTVKHSPVSTTKIKIIFNAFFYKFRKSNYYFPIMKLFYNIGRKIIRVDKKMILFESGIGKQYADSPKNIYEEIINQKLDYKIIWVYNKQHQFIDKETKRVQRLSPKYYYYLFKARYWVNNQNFPAYIKKRPQTTYLQTWHGTPLKKMLYDLEDIYGREEGYVKRIGAAVENWDYLISPSPYATSAFKSAFRYEGEVLEVGYPRNDIFYREDINVLAERIKRTVGIPNDKKVILYAPTFRDDQSSKNNKFLFELEMDLKEMKEELGDEYVVLLRMHVVVNNKLKIDPDLNDFAYNVSNYPDIQELYLLTDILITDYSSVFFDFANTGRPMMFFTYDLENYRDNLRGFYMDFENEAPGPFVFNTKEIIEKVKNIKGVESEYREKYDSFIQKYCGYEDGKAAERVVNKVFKK